MTIKLIKAFRKEPSIVLSAPKKVQAANDQENAQSERISHSKNLGGKN